MKYLFEILGAACSVIAIPALIYSHDTVAATWAVVSLIWIINSAVTKSRL